MEFSEDIDENELIDAFDAQEAEAPSSTESTNPSTLHRDASFRQSTRSNVQESQRKTRIPTLYPTFDSSGPKIPVVGTMTPKQQHQMSLTNAQTIDPAPTHRKEESMTDVELQRKRQEIEREMSVYQERFDYIAHALAGETPHQIQKRKKREEERVERQEKRHEVVEMRLQHRLERLEEREERRARLQARHDQARRSPSPSRDCESQRNLLENVGLHSKNG
ncbi:hypothetical protein DD238_001129 [Peronospora effusa]|uniref:Uncharacterized protein n=1 Tax=Peronospora effusa TaxID=542832 RepID=A0A3M6VLF1_9STRA|nr:hypothetical protein DD238_001129 [Peronospora effusa]RQM13857.1 hypothetical protein DD237_002010 [Peronospora effusa]